MTIFYLSRSILRHVFCWLGVLLLGSLVPTSLVAQTTLSTGDIAFVGFNAVDDQVNGNNSNDKFEFVLLKNVAANTQIFFTDFGWLTGGGFQTVSATAGVGAKDDGIISWTASTSLAAGTKVVILCKYNLGANTGTVTGVEQVPGRTYYMNLGDPGPDNIFAYQAATARDANPTLLAGIRTSGIASTWDATLTNTEFTSSKTTLPTALTANSVNAALYLRGQFYTIAIYKCTLSSGFPKALRNAINTAANWEYPNPGTACEGYIYAPSDPDCPQPSIPTGYNLPIACTFTVTQVQITSQPVNQTVCAGQPASFISTAVNATASQWQLSTNNGSSFSNLANGGVYAGATSTTLTISNTTGLNGNQYRLIASESTEPSSATSSAATLTVNNAPQNVSLLASGSLSCTATTVTLTATSTGGTSYVFSGPGIVSQSGTSATVNQAGTYTVVASSAGSCTASSTTLVTSNTTPPQNVSLTASRTLSCTATTATLTASSTGGINYAFSGPGVTAQGSTTATVNQAGTYTVVVTNASGCTASTTTIITSNTVAPNATLTSSGTLTCAQTSVTLTAGGGSSYIFSGTGIVSQNPTAGTAVVNASGTFSVTVTNASGCSSTTSVIVSANQTPPSISINPSSATLTNASPTASLTAVGTGTYKWSTGATTQVISVTTSGTYSVTLTSPSGCTASASVPVQGSDLTVTLELPQANFATSGTVGNLVVNVFEVAGLPTSSGNVAITITAPIGYTLSFASSLTSINVSGGGTVAVNNGQWTVSNLVSNRQLTLTMNSGAFISGGGESSLGFSITRTTANSGSTANITVNVADDLTMTYDGNLANNVYARVINGL